MIDLTSPKNVVHTKQKLSALCQKSHQLRGCVAVKALLEHSGLPNTARRSDSDG